MGRPDLEAAAARGDLASLRQLLQKGYNVNERGSEQRTALHFASKIFFPDAPQLDLDPRKNDIALEMVQSLLRAKADPDLKDGGGQTALSSACVGGQHAIVMAILAQSPNINTEDLSGESAIHSAARKGNVAILKSLIGSRADVNFAGLAWDKSRASTPIHMAALFGQLENVQTLLDAGAKGDVRNKDGKTPLDFAKQERHAMVIDALARALGKHAEVAEWARVEADKDLKAFENARVVHVLSTRFTFPKGRTGADCCNPREAAAQVKLALERNGDKCYNPNADNSFLMAADRDEANAIWLRTYRKMLTLAQAKGGRVIQIKVANSLSHMQHAEEDMAKDKGVPVIRLDTGNANDSASMTSGGKGVEYWCKNYIAPKTTRPGCPVYETFEVNSV
eukprot:CAMPEP_0119309534 /NCGR_PEP_ID=MMETSP1333-20130426/15820_1 /TAXON_ID=418940 /ORGANISM="Scyphosphaera apsteinii, Strain RCC1455" /LENGTH=393 /DNA_ID=CAMNT_0007313527 /DNA_START=20 /DNA_END=1201 /DNA_ORIENTATION=+